MKISITEPVFFLGEQRKPGDVLECEVGPYRTEVVPGGLKRIAQFVEMAEEIQNPPQAPNAPAVAPPPVPADETKPAVGTFAEATAAALKPAVSATKPAGNPLAARVRALTARRAKFQDMAASVLGEGEAAMTEIETHGPAILEKATSASHDELAAIKDLADSLKESDRSNG